MKNLCLSIVFALRVGICFGQNDFLAKSDSLNKQLANANSDLQRAQLFGQLQDLWRTKNQLKATEYGKSEVEYAKKSGNKNQIAGALYRLAFGYMELGYAPQSIEILTQLLPLTEGKDPNSYATTLAFIAMNYETQRDYDNALKYAQKAHFVGEQLTKENKLEDPRIPLGEVMNLASIFEKRNELDSALFYGRLCYARVLNKKLPPECAFFAWQNRWVYGKIQQRLHHPDLAMKLYREARHYALQMDDGSGIRAVELSMATLFEQQNRLDSAIIYAKKAFERGQTTVSYQTISEAGFLLKKMFQQQKNATQALFYYEAANTAKDSLLNVEKTRQVQLLTFREERRVERQQQALEAERVAFQNQTKQYGLLIGLAVLLLVAFLLYQNNRQKQRANELLQSQQVQIEGLNKDLETKVAQRTAELQTALKEAQEALLKGQTTERKRVASELHDNLGGLLSALKMTTYSLNTQDLHPQEQAIYAQMVGMINDATQQVRSLSHNLLPEELEKRGLVASLENSVYQFNLSNKTIFTLQTQGMDERLSKHVEFNLYAICLELCNNIIKHAQATEAAVELIQKETNLVLMVSDNGLGMSDESTKKGIGLKNLYERAAALGATVKIRSQANEGTLITLKMPIMPE